MDNLYINNKECEKDIKNEELLQIINEFNDIKNNINQNTIKFLKTLNNFNKLCIGGLYIEYNANKTATTMNKYIFLEKYFNLNEPTIRHYEQIINKLMVEEISAGGKMLKFIDSELSDYSISKLQELSVLNKIQIRDLIRLQILSPKLTKEQIRKICKITKDNTIVKKDNYNIEETTKEKIEIEEINEEDIPMAYNPKQVYDFSYFASKTKSQLVNMIMELQDYKHKKI